MLTLIHLLLLLMNFVEITAKPSTALPLLNRLNSQFDVILASASPRRKELLNLMGVTNFRVLVSTFAEDLDKTLYSSSAEYCSETAKKKLEFVYSNILKERLEQNRNFKPVVIIAADTVVDIDNITLEKPASLEDSRRMIQALSSRTHKVHTSVSLLAESQSAVKSISFVESTAVTFADLSAGDIEAYVQSGEGMDKAGSYGIQGLGSQLVAGINGCYFNVMGLPIHRLSRQIADLISEIET